MKEAKVRCLCAEIRLSDLNLTLREGQEIWIQPEQVKLSKDLGHAKSIGAVQITWKERARVTKAPPPPNFRRLSPGQRKKVQAAPDPVPAPAVIVQQVDNDALAKHVKAAVAGEVAKQMSDIKGGLTAQVVALREDLAAQVAAAMAQQGQPIDQAALAATLAAVIQENMPKTVTAAPGSAPARGKADSSAPLYIPSGIVDNNLEGRVDVKETADDAGGAEDAGAKLKALRKRKRADNE